ncbi:DUF5819 family protein [Streptomyces sp. NBC_00568]|uniref:DUF5819 family protein n=1 Tax=Streptomyces sp. NBC_00568 TaxID=2975779 RepID=UPI00225BDD07|nr:DUF5819 family protein [Streptomyces sp. NBC_00568]MCX4989708.1 DUF5819 family protein [Streptomyces sp. NBC_00568]
MDANDGGSKPKPGPVAPEGTAAEEAAPGGATGGTSLPGRQPTDDPMTDDPTADELVADDRAADELVTDDRAADEPVTGDPAADEPVTESVAPPESEGTESEVVAPAEFGAAGTGEAGTEGVSCPEAEAPAGLAALSLRYQIAAALALAVVAVVSCVHLGMVFLHVAPSNTVTKQHGHAIDEWIYPEFEQNWKLFAPNPLQLDITVQVRALVRAEDGTSRETGWYDLSALDGLAIDGNPVPSHTQQNELRRAWDFYIGTHDGENRPTGLRGDLSERYLRRIAVLRLDREHAGGRGAVVERVQLRSQTTNVPPPRWSDEKVSDQPVVRELPWWAVPESDRADGLTEASAP